MLRRGGNAAAPQRFKGRWMFSLRPPETSTHLQQSRSEQVAPGGVVGEGGQDFWVPLTLNTRTSPASLRYQDGSTNQAVYRL